MPEYYAWSDSLMGNASSWTIKYYKGLGTNNQKEGKEYFKDIEKDKKVFIWMDDRDGNAIVLAFMADFQRSIPSMIDGLQPTQRKILLSCFKRNLVKDINFIYKAIMKTFGFDQFSKPPIHGSKNLKPKPSRNLFDVVPVLASSGSNRF
ncbi:hypothetical protein JCGZ_16792 [Jatropha curcas]|uniref:DNA topoisomerase (ATP-hydrolyzing) n=1 Tax=Jatropha curcas TaxID=180498 RepID=A0A067LG24_JATCU|nr:hypothetical protein JCGZ_16792 [Jatropha curcas]